jgi:hypothetical protein
VNWEAISAIGQIVGAIAVVISLIYVAREIRRNARTERVASMDSLNRWLREVAEHPHLGELYYRGIHDFESLQNGDLVRFSVLMDQLFYIYQEMYYQQLEGHLAPHVWGMLEVPMGDINAYPGVQAWWRSRSHWFPEDFAKHVNQRQQTAKAPRLFRQANPNQ